MKGVQSKVKESFEALKGSQGYSNVMEAPRIEKVVVSVGTGKEQDKNKIKLIADRLKQITGQQPVARKAKVSIATFKLREGDEVGYQVTLRGNRMTDFLDKLIHIALPRTKDFRGIKESGIDQMGNYTLGIKEHTIFPETSDEELKDVFGMSVTIVTTAKTRDEAKAFFEHLGLPFIKAELDQSGDSK